MKKTIMFLMIAIGISSVTFGQTKMSNDPKVEAQIVALEKAGWEAWKNKNASWFQANLADEALQVGGAGVLNKSQIVKTAGTDCEVRSFSLDNFKFLMLDKNSALITFTGMQDGVCGGKTIPAKVYSTSVYVKRGGKWLNALYTETPEQGTPVANQSGGSAEQAIRQTMTELFDALNRGDADAAGRIYTDDYQIVMENGKTVTKAERISAMRSGALKFQSVGFDNLKIRLHGDAAIATFRNASGRSNALGSEQENNSVGTVTLIYNGVRWQVASAHLTKRSEN